MRYLSLVLVIGLMGVLGGCGTYINIPRQPADVAWHSPNDFTVKRVAASSLNYILTRTPSPASYAIVLPEGAIPETYRFVMEGLPGQPHRQGEGEVRLPTYTVAGLYVRGRSAQVDIIRPIADASTQLVSVYLEFGVDGWYGKRHRVWNIPVLDALRISTPGETIE